MKPMTLPLLATLLVSPPSRAEDSCHRATLQHLFKTRDTLALIEAQSPFDLEKSTEEAFRIAGLNDPADLLSCQVGQGLCLKELNGQWELLSEDGPQKLTSKTNGRNVVLTHLTHHFSGGDPWYGIGASSWTRELNLTLNPSSLALKSVFIDGANTTFGISKRTRSEGRCARVSAEPIRNRVRDRLKSELLNAMIGAPSAIGRPIEANFLIHPNGSLMQITGVDQASGGVDLLNLETGELHRIPLGSLSSMKPVNVMAILRDMSRLGSKTGPTPDGITTRQLNCVQGANALLGSSDGPRDIQYRGYTRIEISKARTGPGADLGYTPLSRWRILQTGWTGTFRPASLPFGKSEAIAVTDASGNMSFITSGPKGIRSSPILKLDARAANERHGLPANLIAFEDTLCFAR